MPRKSVFEKDKLIQAIINNKNYIYDYASNKIWGPTHPCWKKIELELNNIVSFKYIYTIVLTNRYNILSLLKIEKEEINEQLINFTVSDSNSENDETENNITFTITLSIEEWNKIYKDERQIYKRKDRENSSRAYYTLIPYQWTTVIHEHFYEQTKKPCPITYKNAKIYPLGNIFMKITGECSICNSVFKGIVENPPEPNTRVLIKCSFNGSFESCSDRKKRRIIGQQKDELINKIIDKNMSASYTQKSEANRLMDYGALEPSHLPTMNALRVMKYNFHQKNRLHSDTIMALSILKGTVPYNKIIHDIGYDRFFVHYWTSTEINTYRMYTKKNKIPRITIDATGGIINKIKMISGRETSSIFLYEIGIMDYNNKCQFTAAHMLSERHDSNSISFWLSEWVRSNIVVPKIVVTDQSLALMMAVVKTFTEYSSLAKYLSVCSSIILKETIELPSCMIRNDFNHVMHLICTWTEIKSATFRVKNFYMRSIGLIIISNDFEEIKYLLKCIFTVAMNEEDGMDNNKLPTPCESAKNYLKFRISGQKQLIIDEEINTIKENSKEMVDTLDNDSLLEEIETNIFKQIQDIYEFCLKESQNNLNIGGTHDNMQYNPKIAKKLLDFCKFLPTWSAVMTTFFGYGSVTESSATSESLFNEIKNRVFQHKNLPIRLDEFIQDHINFITGSMKLIKSKPEYNTNETKNDNQMTEIKTEILNETDDDDNNSEKYSDIILINDDNINEIENWRGQGNTTKKLKKKYTDKDPSVLFYNDRSKTKSKIIGILRNGNTPDLKNILVNNKYYTLTNTCPFDSIYQILCSSYADSIQYAKFVDSNLSETLYSLVSNSIRDGVNVQTYKKRAKILLDIFLDGSQTHKSKQLPCNLIHLDCASTANYLLQRLFSNFPSFKEHKKCKSCNFEKKTENITIIANLPTNTIDYLLDVLYDRFSNDIQKCEVCGMCTTEINFTFGNHLFVEICCASLSKHQRNTLNFDLPIILSSLPQKIKINENEFTLRGVINFIAPISKNKEAIGHYISYCWQEHNDTWVKYDDLQRSAKSVRQTTLAAGCQFLVFTV